MNNVILSSTIHAIVILVLQFLILKNFSFSVFDEYSFSIFFYPLIILILPLKTPKSIILVIAFSCGLLADVFYNSPGIHSFALVFMGFMRSHVLKFLEPRGGYRIDHPPIANNYGINWFMTYSSILIFLHILIFFMVDLFSFAYFDKIVLNSIMSFMVSYILVLFYQILIKY